MVSAKRVIQLPHEWEARWYQAKFMSAMDGGLKRAYKIWPRRAGKDSTDLNYCAKESHRRVGAYYYMLPTQRQARKVVWNGIDKIGRRMVDQAFPKELRKRTLEDEMMIELNCGSIFQVVGSDAYDSLVGTNPVGIVFSEWALSNPRAWDYMRPILVENGGWAIFNTTPRGKNHAYTMYERVKNLPDWYVSLMTAAETGHISMADIEAERLAGMSEDRIKQEFFCSWDAQTVGLIYDSYITALEQQGRLCSVPYDPRFPVETAWDIGKRDSTSIWFVQRIANEVRLIDFYDKSGEGLPHFVKVLNSKPYAYSRHIFPHDLNQFEWGAANTRVEMARAHGLTVTVAPKLGVEEGIEATRALLPRCRIDVTNCMHGIRALRHYHYETDAEEQDDTSKASKAAKPEHDWSSHPCDALRYLAVTPEWSGIVPGWVKQFTNPQVMPNWPPKESMQPNGNAGHNWQAEFEKYDPLAAFRPRN